MTDPVEPTEDAEPAEVLGRRRLLSRGAAVAGAAAGAVALGVAGTQPAAATNGQALTQGGSFTGGTTTTTLGVSSATVPPLTLTNAAGPSLKLTSAGADIDDDFDLSVGQVQLTDAAVFIGLRYHDPDVASNVYDYTDGLATYSDLDSLALPYALPAPRRLLDTRKDTRTTSVIDPSGFDSSGRLKSGSFVDVKVDRADQDFTLTGAFFNVVSTASTAGGVLVVYPPDATRTSSTLNFTAGSTIANGCLSGLARTGDYFTVRIYTTAVTHVILDITGVLQNFVPGPAATAAANRKARSAARRPQIRLARRSGSRRG